MKRIFSIFTLAVILSAILGAPALPARAAAVWYAAADGTGSYPCPISAPCSLQQALNYAAQGDTVYLKSGAYTAPNEADTRVMWITKSVTVTGSCDFSSGSAVCSPANPPSVINGESERRVIHIQISSNTDPGSVTLNNLHILNGILASSTACPSDGGYTTRGCGGGIFQVTGPGYQPVNLTIKGCRFENNRGGSEAGTSSGYGGAIFINSSHSLKIYDSIFYGNTASLYGLGKGGAIYANATDFRDVKNTTFEQSTCSTNSGVGKGCAIYASSALNLNFDGNTFNLNNPTTYMNTGSAVFSLDNAHLGIFRNTFTHNFGDSVIFVQGNGAQVPHQLMENKFWHNGAVKVLDYNSNMPVSVFNNFIGDVFVAQPDARLAQAAALTGLRFANTDSGQPADAAVIHNSMAHLDIGIELSGWVNLTLKNSILAWMRLKAVNYTNPSTLAAALNNLDYLDLELGFSGTGRVNGDPKFVNGTSGDFHIKSGSPAKNAAANEGFSSDIDGNHRPFPLNKPDIGADELVIYLRLPVVLK